MLRADQEGKGLSIRRVITFGTFDVFHVGHLRMLRRARELGDELIVGVSSDQLNFSKKQRFPVYPERHRAEIIASLAFVNTVFIEESLELKLSYVREYRADVLVMGDDWAGKFDFCQSDCEVVYLPRTPSISTTELIEVIKSIET